MMAKACSVLACVVVSFAAFLHASAAIAGQAATATVRGAVVDQTGAVIPDVAVTATLVSTGLQRRVTASSEGAFTIPLLPPGTYVIAAQRDGFAPAEVRGLVLNVGDDLTLRIKMSMASVGETVTVSVDSPRVSVSPAVSTLIDRQFVANLALNGRTLQPLLQLVPGVVPAVVTSAEQGQFSVNGQRSSANYFTIDGVSGNVSTALGPGINQMGSGSLPALTTMGGTNNLVSIDALQEFQVQTSAYAPEYGRTPGGQVSIVTRSGSSTYHGTLFDYVRNDAMDATDWFANANSLPKPQLRQHNFGGVLGGPLFLPIRAARPRTFFFFSYEGMRVRQPVVATTDVPDMASREQAPAGVRPYLQGFPQPNGPSNPATGLAPFKASYANPSELDATSIRIDQTLGSATLFGRYNVAPSSSTNRNIAETSLNTLNQIASTTQTLTLGHTQVFTSSLLHELRVNYSRVHGRSSFRLDDFGGAIVPSDSMLYPSFTSSSAAQVGFIVFSGKATTLITGANADNLQRQINIVDTVSYVAGSHALKAGVDYRRVSPEIASLDYTQFAYFDDMGTVRQASPVQVSISAGSPPREPVFTNLSFFAQDTWRVWPRVTLTYGARWEYNPAPKEANGNDAFTVVGFDNPATMTLAAPGTELYHATRNNIAPRVGVSYQLSQKPERETVLRGGFGVFYDLGTGVIAEAFRPGNFPYGSNKNLSGATFPVSLQEAAPAPITTSPPYGFMAIAQPDLELPYTLQWSTAVVQSLGAHQTVTASYVGASGRRLLRNELWSAVNPLFGSTVTAITNGASSDYDALQLQYRRRLSGGVQALASYTWSHSHDDASIELARSLPNRLRPARQDWAPSDFDVRHNFSAAATYDLPGRRGGTWLDAILREWSIDSMVQARSAAPVNLIARTIRSGGYSYNVRPDRVPDVPFYLDDPLAPGGTRFNPAAFAVQTEIRQGTLPRNALRGFSFFQIDATLRRQLTVADRVQIQFRADVFNLLNHPNFGTPVPFLSIPSQFGRATATYGQALGAGGIVGGLSPLYQSGGPRSVQLSLKLQF